MGRPTHRDHSLLTTPDEQLMGDVFDLLGVHLDLVEPHRFEGTASIPIPGDIDGDFRQEGPQRLLSKVTGMFTLELPLVVTLGVVSQA
jgi:hypothetical protein